MSLQLAIRLARNRPKIETRGSNSISRMCCVARFKNNTFIGFNSFRTHPLVLSFQKASPERGPHLHAELDCLRQVIQYVTSLQGVSRRNFRRLDLSDFSFSVARVLADGSPALAKPCLNCQEALSRFNINQVEWTI